LLSKHTTKIGRIVRKKKGEGKKKKRKEKKTAMLSKRKELFFNLVLGFGATVRDGFGGGEINLIVWAGAHEVEIWVHSAATSKLA